MGTQCSLQCQQDKARASSMLKVAQAEASSSYQNYNSGSFHNNQMSRSNADLQRKLGNTSDSEESQDYQMELPASSWQSSGRKYKLSDEADMPLNMDNSSYLGAHQSNVVLTNSDMDVEPFSPDIVTYQHQLQEHEITMIKMKQKMINQKQRAAFETEQQLNKLKKDNNYKGESQKSKKELKKELKRYRMQIMQEKENIENMRKGLQ